MAEATVNTKHKRRSWLAVILSLVLPGLGHVYCGRIVKGIILISLSRMLIPVICRILSVSHSSIRMEVIITSLLASVVVWLVAIIDSWYTARHTPYSYTLKDYNRWYIYVLLVLMSITSSKHIAFNFRANYLEAFRVPFASNYPTIVPNDRFLVNKLAYKTSNPKRGDLIVFTNPENRHEYYVKRVVALAGDTIEMKDDELYINDQKLQRKKLPPSMLDNIRIKDMGVPLEGIVFEEINGDIK